MSHHHSTTTGDAAEVALADRPLACAMFQDLLSHLLISARDSLVLAGLWRQPWRLYHGAGHAGLLWQRHLSYGGDPSDAVAAHAIAYHDAVYRVGARDNEARSAALWRTHAAGLPNTLRDAVDGAIMATADHASHHSDPDAQWLVDLDLTPLGEPWEMFAANSEALRQEAGLPDDRVPPGQRLFLSRLLALPTLYRSPRGSRLLAPTFEAAARRNLARRLG